MAKKVPTHDLVIAGTLGAIMGILGFFITAKLSPIVEKMV